MEAQTVALKTFQGAKTEIDKYVKEVLFIMLGAHVYPARIYHMGLPVDEKASKSKTIFGKLDGCRIGAKELALTVKSSPAFAHFVCGILYAYLVEKNAIVVNFIDTLYAGMAPFYETLDGMCPKLETEEGILKPSAFRAELIELVTEGFNGTIFKGEQTSHVHISDDEDYAKFIKVLRACTHDLLINVPLAINGDKPVPTATFDFSQAYYKLFCGVSAEHAQVLVKYCGECITKAAPVAKGKKGETASKKNTSSPANQPGSEASPPPNFEDSAAPPSAW